MYFKRIYETIQFCFKKKGKISELFSYCWRISERINLKYLLKLYTSILKSEQTLVKIRKIIISQKGKEEKYLLYCNIIKR